MVFHPDSPLSADSSGRPSARIGTGTYDHAGVTVSSTGNCTSGCPDQENLGACPEQHSLSGIDAGHPAQDLVEHAIQTTDFVGDLPGVTGDLTMRKLAAFSIDWAREEMWVDTGVRPADETCSDAEDLLVAWGWTHIRTRKEDAAKRRGRWDFYSEQGD